MLRILNVLLSLILATAPALAQSVQLAPGQVMGNFGTIISPARPTFLNWFAITAITPQSLGFKCDNTQESGIVQALHNAVSNTNPVAYIPAGSICRDSGNVTVTKRNFKFRGVSVKNEWPDQPSQIIYTGTATRFIDARDARGFGCDGVQIMYSSSVWAGTLIDLGTATPGSAISAFGSIENCRLGTDTDRTGTATLLALTGTVDQLINRSYFYHGAPAIKGQALIGQNVRTTIKETTFARSDTIPIQECGESWILSGVTFEPMANGQAGAFTNTAGLYCKAMSIRGGWAGDVSVAGGTWFNGTWQGLDVTAFQIAGDLGAATQGFNFIGSSGVNIGDGSRFELLNTAINCGTSTANDGVVIGAAKFVGVTSQISNASNCSNISSEGNSPSMSRATAGQIMIGQSGADIAPKTMSGNIAINAAGVTTIQPAVVANSMLVNPATTVNGQTCTLGSPCTMTAAASSATVGTTDILGGTNARVLFDSAGKLGEYTISGSGSVAMTTSGVFTTPNLGTPTALVGTNITGTALGFTANAANTAPVSGLTGAGAGCLTWLSTPSSSNLRACLTDETGMGAAYFQGGDIGTPSAGVLTNATGLPTTGLTGTLQAAQEPAHTGDVTNTAGSLALAIGATKVTSAMLNTDVFSTAHSWAGQQTFVAPILGTPASGVATNLTGTAASLTAGTASASPVSGLTGAGTGVKTALTVNTNSAGAFVVNGTGNILQASPSLPTGTTSGTAVMMGMGSTCTLTPASSTRVQINFRGSAADTALGGIVISARFGTGTAPANAAAASGTQVGVTTPITPGVVNGNNAFSVGGNITGLSVGTAYWFDMTMLSGGGTVSITAVSCDAFEIP